MKICFLASASSIHSYKWIKYFSNFGYEITWISIHKKLYDMPEGVRYIEIQSKYKLVALFKAIFTMNKCSVDFVHVHYLGLYGFISLFSNQKLIATAWGSDILINTQNFFKRTVIKKILNKMVMIVCPSNNIIKIIIELGIDKNKICFIRSNGIDSKIFSKQLVNDNLRQKLEVLDKLSIISTRAFEDIYDIRTLIQAMPIVLKKVSNAKLILVGEGTKKSKLEALVKELKLENIVSFVGLIPNDELPSLLSNMDIYVSTSLSDAGLASSTAEAMACETVVVVSNSAGNDKWIDDGKNGFIFSVQDYKKLADILIKLLNDEKLRLKIGKEGRDIIVKNNDYENEMHKVNDIYIKLKKKLIY